MYCEHRDRLYRRNHAGDHDFNGTWKLVVPISLQQAVLEDCHDSLNAAHGGTFKTLERVRRDYHWPGMRKAIIKYVKGCIVCKTTKPPNSGQQAFMGQERTPRGKFQVLCLDFIGPLPLSDNGNRWILVVIDNFTKYVVAEPLRSRPPWKPSEYSKSEYSRNLVAQKPLSSTTVHSSAQEPCKPSPNSSKLICGTRPPTTRRPIPRRQPTTQS